MRVARLDIMSVDTPHTAESILYILYDIPAKDQIDRDLPRHTATLYWPFAGERHRENGMIL